MADMTESQLAVQDDVSEARAHVSDARDSLDCAESCETAADLRTNLENALNELDNAMLEVRELLSRLKK